MVCCTVIGELDMQAALCERYPIEFNRGDPPRNSLWVIHDDFIT
jgi:hypothetical protein